MGIFFQLFQDAGAWGTEVEPEADKAWEIVLTLKTFIFHTRWELLHVGLMLVHRQLLSLPGCAYTDKM